MSDLVALVPPEISAPVALLLCLVSFVTSGIAAALGLGGGVLLLGVMAAALPTAAVIPLHGVVQVGSNLGRAVVQRRNVDYPILAYFALGSLLGAYAGGRVAVALPETVLKVALGLFILYLAWGPRPRFGRVAEPAYVAAGAVGAFLTMFFGATGPFVAAVLATRRLDRHQVIGTHAAFMTVQHCLKIVVFGVLGFAFGPWVPLLAAMIATGFLGTLAGTRLLKHLPEARFRLAFKLLLSLLAANLILGATGLP